MPKESAAVFLVRDYTRFEDLPLEVLNKLTYSVYVVDYEWVYLFINRHAQELVAELSDSLIGRSALEVFKDKKFATVFDKIMYAFDQKIPLDTTVTSPLRGKQVIIKGYPLADCYFFSVVTIPAKFELFEELRSLLGKKKP